MNEVIVSMNNISKSFPGVKALDHVKFELRSGEVMALLGENGAGKSTLMKILSGVYTRDEGTMEIFGKSYDDLTPKQAQEAGVAIIHQELNMCKHLTVTENMFLGREIKGGLSLNNGKMRKEAKRVLDDLRIDISSDQIVGDLPVSKQQMEMVDRIVRSPQYMDLNKRQAQYLALQNQINPHFLYNTLESIRGEAIIAGLDGVADMTEALARFFRYTITKVENLVSVEEELDNCETYFGIQKYRFGDRLQLHIDYDIAEYEKIMNCRIPKLTLQPILENSIIHGVELKVGGGNLYIRFQCTKDRLIIRISDDGVGMDEMTLAKLNQKLGKSTKAFHDNEEKQGGIALVNVNNRIHLIFGDEYGMHVYSVPGEGTDVEITIPMLTDDRQVKNRSVLA